MGQQELHPSYTRKKQPKLREILGFRSEVEPVIICCLVFSVCCSPQGKVYPLPNEQGNSVTAMLMDTCRRPYLFRTHLGVFTSLATLVSYNVQVLDYINSYFEVTVSCVHSLGLSVALTGGHIFHMS